jgi:hypothetical protein
MPSVELLDLCITVYASLVPDVLLHAFSWLHVIIALLLQGMYVIVEHD